VSSDDTAPHALPPVGQVVLTMKGVEIDRALLVPGRFVIGRTADNDMQIDSKFVSRHHMQLVMSLDGCVVEDLNSTNGVYLNGKRVRKHKLLPGDVLKLGLHELTYSRADLATGPAQDARATQTTVLQDADYEVDDEDEEADPDEADDRGSTYSSMPRGS
jgi:pSer/pThr/pTyr-binding forkhead associated (FHA) protein